MSELKTIDGIQVLFLNDKSELSKSEAYTKAKEAGVEMLIVVGDDGAGRLEQMLAGRSLKEFINTNKEKEKPESKPLSEIINEDNMHNKAFKIEALPTFVEPFIPHLPKPHNQRKWYEKRKRK